MIVARGALEALSREVMASARSPWQGRQGVQPGYHESVWMLVNTMELELSDLVV